MGSICLCLQLAPTLFAGKIEHRLSKNEVNMQRRAGLAALERNTLSQSSYTQLSTDISERQLQEFQLQLTQFRSALDEAP